MSMNPLAIFDRLSTRATFRGSTGSFCGVLGTLLCIGTYIWMYLFITIAFFQGSYYQSQFESQIPSDTKFHVPSDAKFALVFLNRSSKATANHNTLKQFLNTRIYQTSTSGQSYYQIANKCDSNYFEDSVNAITLQDCYTFTPNRVFPYAFKASPSSSIFNPSYTGFQLTYNCYSPFTCASTGTTQISVRNNLIATFQNFSVLFYFSTKVLQPNGQNKHQLYYISSGQFNSPFTLTTNLDAQVIISNITMDYSVFPWRSIVNMSNLAWYGFVRGGTKNSTTITSLPRFNVVSAPYQNFVFRYYMKGDRWLGILGGGLFLISFGFYLLCCHYNQSKYRITAAQELLLQKNGAAQNNTLQIFKPPQISLNYYVLRFFLRYHNPAIEKATQMQDIIRILKKQKVAFKNLLKNKKQLVEKPRRLYFPQLQEQKQNKKKEDQSRIPNIQGSTLKAHNSVTMFGQTNPPNQNKNQLDQSNNLKNEPEQSYEQLNQSPLKSSNKSHEQMQIFSNPDKPQRRQDKQTQQNIEDLAKLLNMHPQVVRTLQNSENTGKLFSNSSILMHLQNNRDNYDQLIESESYDDRPPQVTKSKCEYFISKALQICKSLDLYSVKIKFNPGKASFSLVGVINTIVICAFFAFSVYFLIRDHNTYQTSISKDFLQPSQIKYTLITGQKFRPALCLSFQAKALIDSNVTLQFYTYSGQKMTFYRPINLQIGQGSLLGITPSSLYANLDTSNCFVFPDNVKIEMGGYNTAHQAYFGFRFVGRCTGTVQTCESMLNATNANLYSFLNAPSNTFTFYSPINQYHPFRNTIYSGEVFPRILREGTARFNATSSVEETLYLDRSQLLDNFNKKFVGQPAVLIEETVSTLRYQLATGIKYVNSSTAYYDFKARPSGNITKIYLNGNTLYMMLGIIGGLLFIIGVIGRLGNSYNEYNVRTKLAEELYNQKIYNYNALIKILFLLGGRRFCCGKLRKKLERMLLVDEKIIYDLNFIQTVKEVQTCWKLSATSFQTLEEQLMAQIYFKEIANQANIKSDDQYQSDKFGEQLLQSEQQWQGGGNKIMNINPIQNQNPPQEQPMQPINQDHQSSIDQQFEGSQAKEVNKQIEQVQSSQIYKGQQYYQLLKREQCRYLLDFFKKEPQLNINGKYRVGSIFGFMLTILTIALIVSIMGYFLSYYNSNENYRISYNRGMLIDPDNTPPLQLDTNSNFRVAVGFYSKPGMTFVNVSNLINTTANSTISISLFQASQFWSNSRLEIRQTKYDLIPCPADYFKGFISPNDDPSYYSSITNGFCLPYNVKLNLTSNVIDKMQFFKVSVYNNTMAGSATLTTLTTSFPMGVYMTVPFISVADKSFSYQVQQIRPNTQTLTRAYEVNITLTRQQMTFTTPNYTISQNGTTIQNYNYIEDRAYQRTMTAAPTTVARVYNITFSHSGYTETYVLKYPDIPQLFGYFGGIIFLIIAVVGFIATSFNNYLRDYQIGRSLYLFAPKNNKKQRKNKNNKEKENYLQSVNNLNEFDVFRAWICTVPATCLQSYSWNQNLLIVHTIQQKAQEDLDLCNFYKKHLLIKDNINSANKLSANQKIPVTNIYSKQIILQQQSLKQISNENNHPLSQLKFRLHQLSSRSQFRLQKGQLQKVLSQDYMVRCMLAQRQVKQQISLKPQKQGRNNEKLPFQFRQQVDLPRQSRQPLLFHQQQIHQQQEVIDYEKNLQKPPLQVNEGQIEENQAQLMQPNIRQFNLNNEDENNSEFK